MELFTPWRTTKIPVGNFFRFLLSFVYTSICPSVTCNILIHAFLTWSWGRRPSWSPTLSPSSVVTSPFGFPPLGYFLFFDKDIFLSALQIVLLVSRHHRWGLKLKDWTAALEYPSKKWKFFWNAADRLSSLRRWMLITDPRAAEKWAQDYTGSPSQQEGLGLGAAYLLTDVKQN